MAKRIQPEWPKPEENIKPALKLYNSLTKKKEIFTPINGNKVYWYSCGPTVYDASHMGHARSYISFDILRRVLSDYFGYDVFYVMNITDIDDKIIVRARQQYLFNDYISKNSNNFKQLLNDKNEALEKYKEKLNQTNDPDKVAMVQRIIQSVNESSTQFETALNHPGDDIEKYYKNFIDSTKDIFFSWLDSKFGKTIKDNSIFSELPKYWEEEYHKDMSALNILKPNVLTRVSEYVDEIIVFIKKIIENGYAYESNGSVYFDVAEFDKKENHFYAKLVPEAYGDTSSLQEGEGELTTSEKNEKKSPNDFALWKKSKDGEPRWVSPWGVGRPGWHIECSVMASEICGAKLDVHTGGVDLKFPHHDNEMAQSEAYFDSYDWVKYFLHSGHLTISGCKMSKSLKNFITIKDALKKHSSRQIRLVFLLHSWNNTLDYSDNTMEMAIQYEKILNEFFLNIKHLSRSMKDIYKKWTNGDVNLHNSFLQTKEKVYLALCDNIDTRSVLDSIRELISQTNIYIKEKNQDVSMVLLEDIAVYITHILKIFGLVGGDNKIGFPITSGQENQNIEDTLMPYLEILSAFRNKIRTLAKSIKATDILSECDYLRDDVLPNVGVRLEDKEGCPSAIKLVDRETLLRERELKKQAESEKQALKEKQKLEQEAVKALKEAQKKIPPKDMFLNEIDKYSKFDENGLPTHDKDGKELSKGLVKKLQKLQMAQEKKYNDYLETLKNGEI